MAGKLVAGKWRTERSRRERDNEGTKETVKSVLARLIQESRRAASSSRSTPLAQAPTGCPACHVGCECREACGVRPVRPVFLLDCLSLTLRFERSEALQFLIMPH